MAAAGEGYSFLAPPSVVAAWQGRKEAEAEERGSQASIVAECKHCTAIVCPACGAGGCRDVRFGKRIK